MAASVRSDRVSNEWRTLMNLYKKNIIYFNVNCHRVDKPRALPISVSLYLTHTRAPRDSLSRGHTIFNRVLYNISSRLLLANFTQFLNFDLMQTHATLSHLERADRPNRKQMRCITTSNGRKMDEVAV